MYPFGQPALPAFTAPQPSIAIVQPAAPQPVYTLQTAQPTYAALPPPPPLTIVTPQPPQPTYAAPQISQPSVVYGSVSTQPAYASYQPQPTVVVSGPPPVQPPTYSSFQPSFPSPQQRPPFPQQQQTYAEFPGQSPMPQSSIYESAYGTQRDNTPQKVILEIHQQGSSPSGQQTEQSSLYSMPPKPLSRFDSTEERSQNIYESDDLFEPEPFTKLTNFPAPLSPDPTLNPLQRMVSSRLRMASSAATTMPQRPRLAGMQQRPQMPTPSQQSMVGGQMQRLQTPRQQRPPMGSRMPPPASQHRPPTAGQPRLPSSGPPQRPPMGGQPRLPTSGPPQRGGPQRRQMVRQGSAWDQGKGLSGVADARRMKKKS